MRVNFYSSLREKFGKRVEIDKEEISINSLIEMLGIKEYIVENDNLLLGMMILVNGKNIAHLKGLETIVKNNDNVDFFPPPPPHIVCINRDIIPFLKRRT